MFPNAVLGQLLFLIYINDLQIGASSNCNFFASNTSLFSVVNGIQSSACAATLRNDLKQMNFSMKNDFQS